MVLLVVLGLGRGTFTAAVIIITSNGSKNSHRPSRWHWHPGFLGCKPGVTITATPDGPHFLTTDFHLPRQIFDFDLGHVLVSLGSRFTWPVRVLLDSDL